MERPVGPVGPSPLERAAPLLGAVLLVAVVLAAAVVVALTHEGSPVTSPFASNGDDDVPTDALRDAGDAAASASADVDAEARPACVGDAACLAWTVEQPGRGPVWRDVSVDGDLLVLTDRLGTTALDVDDGSTRWRIEADPTADTGARGHAVSDSLVLLIEREGVLRAYDRSTGALRWISPLPAALRTIHASDHDGVVVVITDAIGGAAGAVRLVAAFDLATGERRWSRPASSAALTAAGPVVFDGPGSLRGLDPDSGSMRWEASVDGSLGGVVGVGAYAVFVGGEQTVVAEGSSGRTTVTTGPRPAVVSVDHDEAVVLLGTDRVELVTGTGSRWAVDAPSDACCVAFVDGDVVVVDRDGGRTVLAGDDGSVLDRYPGRGDGGLVGSAWLVGGDGDSSAGRPHGSAPDVAALQVFEVDGARSVAATPPGIAITGMPDGVVVSGEGWMSRIRTD